MLFKKFIVAIALLLICSSAYGQTGTSAIAGRIIDSLTREPIEYATVTLFTDLNPTPVGGMITTANGSFGINKLSPGTYHLRVEFIGYKMKMIDGLVLDKGTTKLNVGVISLNSSSRHLNEVTVTADHALLENHIDKLVYNAEKDVTSQNGVATDILQKVPQVSVDVNGNVELQGSTNVRVFINGKPSTMFDNNLAEALQAIPASQIKSIEVITSPGAKYDAEGTAGIIDIILKDNKSKGINGSVTGSAGTRLENGAINLHVHKKDLDINMSVSGNAALPGNTLNTLNRQADSATLTQSGNGQTQRNSYKGQLGFGWTINKKNSISGSIAYNNFGHISDNNTDQHQAFYYPTPTDIYTSREAHNNFRYAATDWNIDYKKQFDNEKQELDISIQSSTGRDNTDFEQTQYNADPNYLLSGTKGNNLTNDRETYLIIDYAQPIGKKILLETGAKGSFNNINSNSDYYTLNTNSNTYYNDSSLSDNFTYNRNVYAGYFSLTVPLSATNSVKAGVREEYTQNNAHFQNAPGNIVPSYNTVIPTITFSHQFSSLQTLRFSFSGRLQRPDYDDLNPFINASDPTNLTSGNPNLRPERTQYGEVSYSRSFKKGGNILINLFYRNTHDDEQNYVYYYPTLTVGDSVYRNVSVNTQANVGTQQTVALNIFGSLPITSKLEIRCNGAVFHKYIMSHIVQGTTLSATNYRINMNAAYQFSETLAGEFFGNFRSAHTEIQGTFPAFTTYSFAIRKLIFNKKGSIAFTTTNPFNEYVNQETNITGVNFHLQSSNKIPYRSFGLSFSYKFGRVDYKEKKEEHNTPEEDG